MAKITKKTTQEAFETLNYELKILRSQRYKITWLIRKIEIELQLGNF